METEPVQVKICGIRTLEDALACAEAGADMLGFNFYKPGPRYIAPDVAAKICNGLRDQLGVACPLLIGVFANESVGMVSDVTNHVSLDAAQLSGDESDDMLAELRGIAFKAIRPPNRTLALEDVRYFSRQFPTNERLPSLLLDAHHPQLYGGTGEQAASEVVLAIKPLVPRLMLAGGLNPDNVAGRVQQFQPWGVDVASGVEDDRPGVKNPDKVRAFLAAARGTL